MKKGTFLTLALGLILWACQSGLDSPASPSPHTAFPEGIQQQVEEPAQPAAPNEGGEERGCEIVQVQRARIKVETKCSAVRFNVPATVTLGSGYYNIWLPAINAGTKLGPFEYGVWSPWQSMEEGEYVYALAAETKTADGTIYQCDRHKGTFKVECPCVQGPAPKCEFGLAVYNPKNCTYECPPCVTPEQPKCQYGPPQIDGCGWKCPPCVLPPPIQCEFGPPISDMKSCSWSCPPCVVEWIEQSPVRENETDYGDCVPLLATHTTPPPTVDCPGTQSRTVDIVVYEINSCTEETREKSRNNITESAECTAQCEQPICHTQNKREGTTTVTKWCKYRTQSCSSCRTTRTSTYKYSKTCTVGNGVYKWQCQNVPPGTPGHYPNHFNANSHDDFFGPCVPSKCYSIVN